MSDHTEADYGREDGYADALAGRGISPTARDDDEYSVAYIEAYQRGAIDRTTEQLLSGSPADVFRVGDFADHKSGELDPRRVVRVEGAHLYLDILGATAGPFPAENYDRLPPVSS